MRNSADTGARERLIAILREAPMPYRESTLTDEEWDEAYDEWWHKYASESALAAGVGVPPDTATKALIRARDEISKVEFDKVVVSDAIWAALDALAGVGEARPAEPPHEHHYTRKEGCPQCDALVSAPTRERPDARTDDEHQREIWESRCPHLLAERDGLLAEVGRLREQLDAATDQFIQADAERRLAEARVSALTRALERIARPHPLDLFATDEERADYWSSHALEMRAAARAALGVVGPPTNSVSALGQKASETRGGES